MRSQATKPLSKKGALGKTALKASAKQSKRKPISPKKTKTLVSKSLVKSPKKTSKDDANSSNNDSESSNTEKNDTSTDSIKSGPSKPSTSRSNSPTKKSKKEPKEKKGEVKNSPEIKKIVSKKVIRKSKMTNKKGETDNDDVKYKINLDAVKKPSSKFCKAKTVIKKSGAHQKKKVVSPKKQDVQEKEQRDNEQTKTDNLDEKNESDNLKLLERKDEDKKDNYTTSNQNKTSIDVLPIITNPTLTTNNQSETPKTETERPPKFFTSSRSPRTVDIDVKCLKNSKGNLSVSERFLSLKTDEVKNPSNTLVSQGPEIDVYTFTEKVDSPKSILSDFRSPINKNVGRVRPIARVKGTIIDKKTDSEKKKYSPHRPIEEVVKQLKANKRSEDINALSQSQDTLSSTSLDSSAISSSEKEAEENPKPIVSKSYKMVARKSSITGKPFSPIKFYEQDLSLPKSETATISPSTTVKKVSNKGKKQQKKVNLTDDELDTSKFSFAKNTFQYSSSDESVSESNDDNDSKCSFESNSPKSRKTKKRKYKRITDSIIKKNTSKELKELSKDSLVDLKDESLIVGNDKPSKRRLKLLSMWAGPKKHRMASLNAIAKVHCLYENESRTSMELGLMKTVDRQPIPSTSKACAIKKKEIKPKDVEKQESTSESEYENKKDKKDDSSESSDDNPPARTLRGVPGIRSAGKYWDPRSSTSSSEDSELESKKKAASAEKKKTASKTSSSKSDTEKPPAKMKKTAGVPVKKKRNRNEVVMDLKDMVVQKRMASLNATAILAASYEKRSPKSSKDDTTSDSCSDESFSQKSKNGVSSGVKSEIKHEDTKNEMDESVTADSKQKVEVIVNQDTDVTITGVYSTHHHEGFCTVSGMQYRISSTSHTQTTATANCDKEGCSREEARYTPLSALSSMNPPADHAHGHPHPVPELGGLARRAAGCSSAFSAPSPAAHHEPGYYQPAGPMIKESGADAERALARYHPPHYHAPHPPVLQQYGPPYYPADLCYGRYYRPPGPPYHMPPQPDAQMVGVGSEPYPPPQYYGTPPCYQHSPQRYPYVEYRCPCPLNACPKNGLIGPATGKAPTGGGPADVPSALAPPGGAFRGKVRACAMDAAADTHGSGKDPPLEPEPPAAADAPHPCPLPAIGGASPKRELYDVRDKIRLVGDLPGPAEALGPPSPARGSAGACAPQPPPAAPRRARLGKDMARRSLVLADTGQLLTPQPPPAHHSDADDDVMAISPPTCAPIDLSSSDERSTPLVDVKKENEGPTCATSRKPDAQALREHNSSSQETTESTEPTKAVKRRYSRPKLEIDMKDTQLEESCKTNGIGEHVKLQKRRKVSGDQTTITRPETAAKETKKRTPSTKKSPKTPTSEKRAVKRKLENSNASTPKSKRMLLATSTEDDVRLKDGLEEKPKIKAALLLDNLIRKNSIDRVDAKGYNSDKELNPAELFLSPSETASQMSSKKTLNINNNVVENSAPMSGVRPNTIAAVSQLIEKKLAYKKLEKVDSKVTQNLKTVLKQPTEKCKLKNEKNILNSVSKSDIKAIETVKDSSQDNVVKESISFSNNKNNSVVDDGPKSAKVTKATKSKAGINKNEGKSKVVNESRSVLNKSTEKTEVQKRDLIIANTENKPLEANLPEKTKLTKPKINKTNGHIKTKSIENVAKLLVAKKPTVDANADDLRDSGTDQAKDIVESLVNRIAEKSKVDKLSKLNGETRTKSVEKVAMQLEASKAAAKDGEVVSEETKPQQTTDVIVKATEKPKRCKLTAESKEEKKKKVEKVVKLLVSKKPAIKTDEATLVVEDACLGVEGGRRARRRRSGAGRGGARRRHTPPHAPPPPAPRAPPRWSNGWHWDGEPYICKISVNNDSRLDRTARCWPRMTHTSGDSITQGDCVLLKASTGRAQQPFVAKAASLWENPEDGEMMVSLVWYYRPEHTERGREPSDAPDEVFASRHRDANSVACIEDKCYVLSFNEYCRYRKRLKAIEEGVTIPTSIVPPLPLSDMSAAPTDARLPPSVSPELVLFCRKIYDFRSKKVQVSNK